MDGSRPTIGFIGLGAIGSPMARRLVDAGYELVVYDISEPALRVFAGSARLARSAREVADGAQIVFVCLASLPAHDTVVLGADGIVAGGAARICVITSTTGPELVARMQIGLAARGIALVDAPMTGGRVRAAAGTLTVMLSGPEDAIAAVEPVLRCYAGRIVHFGELAGRAQVMKLVNNVMSAVNFAIAAEALVFGSKAGLDPEAMLEVINNGTGKNDASLTVIPQNVLTRRFDFGSPMAVILKDMGAAVAEADRLGVPVAMTRAVTAMFERAIANGVSAQADQTELVRDLERSAGVEVERTR
ncbi:2-hydroxy-3-oxopropionate reductase [Bosea sp. AK1]|nr:2-hydroxy-3-oxopropionate reductase [Bosea sp. AK1]